MATEQQIQRVLMFLAEVRECANCGARFRFGDLDCPHCGADLDDLLRRWAEELVDGLASEP